MSWLLNGTDVNTPAVTGTPSPTSNETFSINGALNGLFGVAQAVLPVWAANNKNAAAQTNPTAGSNASGYGIAIGGGALLLVAAGLAAYLLFRK